MSARFFTTLVYGLKKQYSPYPMAVSEIQARTSRYLKGLTGWLARKVIDDGANPEDADVRFQLALLQGWVSAGVNLAVFVLKVGLGALLGSIALIADGMESLSDVAASILIVVGSKWSRKPPDERHPYGHGRAEHILALVTAIVLVIVGLGLAKEAIVQIIRPRAYDAGWIVIVLVALTIPIKEWLTLFSRALSRATGSPLMEGGYWLLRFDAINTTLVCVALILSKRGWHTWDGWVGLVISAFVIHTGLKFAWERIIPLLGEAPSREDIDKVQSTAKGFDGVNGVHDIHIHQYGDTRLITLHIEVDANVSPIEIHDLAEDVEASIDKGMNAKTTVHVDPIDRTHPMYKEMEQVLSELARNTPEVVGVHDVRVSGAASAPIVSADIVVRMSEPEASFENLANQLTEKVHNRINQPIQISLQIESSFYA